MGLVGSPTPFSNLNPATLSRLAGPIYGARVTNTLSTSGPAAAAALQNAVNGVTGALAPVAAAQSAGQSPSAAQIQAASQQAWAEAQGAPPGLSEAAMQIGSTLVSVGEASKWDVQGQMNPLGSVMRRASRPVKILPAVVTLNAQGAGSLSWAPQEAFEGFRLCIPSGQPGIAAAGATFISQLQAGDRLMVAQAGRIPVNCLRENSDVGRMDFPIVSLGETISCTVSGGTANAELGAVIVGYGSRPRVLPAGAEILYSRYEPFDTTADTGSNVATITLQPQRNIIMRRIAFDDSVANFNSLYVSSINIQDLPQLIQNVELPAQMFSELATDDWIDFDLCQLGGTITIGLRNANSNTVVAQGVAVVDVVRLPNEPRR